jgi:outer membrane protein assembly factor BamB
MKEDFVTRLELQLTRAERVQERGGTLPRLAAPVRAWRRPPVAAAGLAAAILIALAAIALTRGGDEQRVVGHRPAVVSRTWLAPTPDERCTTACDVNDPFVGLASGFGSAWIGGEQHGEVVRLDPVTRKVIARIPVGTGPTDVLTTGDAVWVVVNPAQQASTLVRIDPERNRVTARVAIPRVSVWPKLLGDDRAIWVLGQEQAVRFDPPRGAIADTVTWNFSSGAFARSFGLAGDDLWARAEDGALLRFDAHTGARAGQATSTPGAATLAVLPDDGVIAANDDGTVTRIDAGSGRARWTVRLAGQDAPISPGSGRTERTVAVTGGTVWVLHQISRPIVQRLTALDLANGRTLTGTALKDYGAAWLKPIGDRLWYLAPAGYAVEVRP